MFEITEALKNRFYTKVRKSEGCWMWLGTKRAKYGGFWIDRAAHSAHRISYLIHKGEIPDGLWVLHTCDVRMCVNPDHLYVGTPKQNTADARDRGRLTTGEKHWTSREKERRTRGEKHGKSKFTESQVMEIRKKSQEGLPYRKLAILYGVSNCCIQSIIYGKTWTHLPLLPRK
jgi:hypothetical protein